jgi:hypothetical protein
MPKINAVSKVPVVKVPAPKLPGRRGTRAQPKGGGQWIETAKVVFLLQRPRPRRRQPSSPSFRQIALVVVSAGIILVIVRVAAARVKSRASEVSSPTPSISGDDTTPGGDTPAGSDTPAGNATTAGNDTTAGDANTRTDTAPGNENKLTDTVQKEMSHGSDGSG